MKIENLIKIPRNAICIESNSFHSVHTDPKNENKIFSWYSKQNNLEAREILNMSGFGTFLEYENGFLWLVPVEDRSRIFESRIIIDRFKDDK